jgi:hypothetical protein
MMISNMNIASVKSRIKKTCIWGRLKIMYNDYLMNKKLATLEHEIVGNGTHFRMLLINHFFDGEIEALTKVVERHADLSMFSITPGPFFSRAPVYFPEKVHNASIPYDDPDLDEVRKQYRVYCEKLFIRLYARYPFHCVITPSDSFYWLREFLAVCKEKKITTIVADKEGTISPQSFETEPYRTKQYFPPISNYFFVWSLRQKEFWLKAGVSPDRILVIGSARTDLFINLPVVSVKKNLLFFDFDSDAYINNLDWQASGWQGERNWSYLRNAIHKILAEIAREYPEINILIKCHPQQVVTNFPALDHESLGNITIVKGAPLGIPTMIANSHAVIGFQTTALLEASLTNTPVIYVAWGELYEKVSHRILPWHENGYGMHWCRSAEEVKSRIKEILQGQNTNNKKKLDQSKLAEYFHDYNGGTAKRLIDSAILVTGRRDLLHFERSKDTD